MGKLLELDDLSGQVARLAADIGLRELARRWDMSHATVSRVSRGYPPDAANYIKICRLLASPPAPVVQG